MNIPVTGPYTASSLNYQQQLRILCLVCYLGIPITNPCAIKSFLLAERTEELKKQQSIRQRLSLGLISSPPSDQRRDSAHLNIRHLEL